MVGLKTFIWSHKLKLISDENSEPQKTENSLDSENVFKNRMKNLYNLQNTAKNDFERIIFKNMNEQFRQYEKKILALSRLGLLKIS